LQGIDDLIFNQKGSGMKYTMIVDNVKCGGCVKSIEEGLAVLDGVQEVSVDIPTGCVSLEAEEGLEQSLTDTLSGLGYPVKSTVTG
jgi:copper chaperone